MPNGGHPPSCFFCVWVDKSDDLTIVHCRRHKMTVLQPLFTFCPDLRSEEAPWYSDFIAADRISGADIYIWNDPDDRTAGYTPLAPIPTYARWSPSRIKAAIADVRRKAVVSDNMQLLQDKRQSNIEVLKQFRGRLETHVLAKGAELGAWSGSGAPSRHVLSVATRSQKALLYVKVSMKERGFWGLTKNQLDAMESAEVKWHVVLLHKSPDRGYLIPAGEVRARITSGDWRLAADGDYKVWENDTLKSGLRFCSVAECVALLP